MQLRKETRAITFFFGLKTYVRCDRITFNTLMLCTIECDLCHSFGYTYKLPSSPWRKKT